MICKKGNCTACAIGNIVAGCMGIRVPKLSEMKHGINVPEVSILTSLVSRNIYSTNVDKVIKNTTGYSFDQLSKIENAFESNTKIHWHDYKRCFELKVLKDQFNGLMAVIKVLDQIHENTDTAITETSKHKFIKKTQLT